MNTREKLITIIKNKRCDDLYCCGCPLWRGCKAEKPMPWVYKRALRRYSELFGTKRLREDIVEALV